MPKKSIDLAVPSPPAWIQAVMNDFDLFLTDHANCERKASALAMSMAMKYPDRTEIIPDLIALAQEELEHFAQVYRVMQQRSLRLTKDRQDPYVTQLLAAMRNGRDDRLLDRLLVASVIECRGAERFRLVAERIDGDEELRIFYRNLWASEAKHGHVFVDMALRYFDISAVYTRLDRFTELEAEIVTGLEINPYLH